ncbi:FAD-dependent oxidoreductase [Nocardia huaxiensis]|uniref:FAD-dependent oxidoreductase n=1 Tax=Nocardia huaxiensis TaxID=2755382 RepID=UPI001E47C15F|nr:FAD-dependent oxidoreductase [Nocardia huaxiensis]UFS98555.1 FAD-dependent oxidoreductase [Nocardia huaxiensis]
MAYVITQRCCNDASCVSECPVDCIRPTPEQPEFATAEMLYIDPDTCIDCGACADACPVGAIFPEDELSASLARFRDLNADYFRWRPLAADTAPVPPPTPLPIGQGPLRVAIVGAGPAACYAAQDLLARGALVDIFDRLPTPWGLVRGGVAPDHAHTKTVTEAFRPLLRHPNVRFHLNVEVGRHISHDELIEHRHAVLYAVGASSDRRLGVPGEDLPGSHSATEFVAWYNGHPDYADRAFDLSGERAVIVGNGNVALDIARVLTTDPDLLASTDIADHALDALRQSRIREVVLLGRRGPAQAAYTTPEFLALGHLPGVEVVIDESEVELDPASAALLDDPQADPSSRWKVSAAREYAARPAESGTKRIVFRYLASPLEIRGADRVEAIDIVRNDLARVGDELSARATDSTEVLATGLVLRSIGYRGEPLRGLPFDHDRGVVPNDRGRVAAGVYVAGWIKRGPRGVIGTNRFDAAETVEVLAADFLAGELTEPAHDHDALTALVASRRPEVVDRAGWAAIDEAERAAGKVVSRPRVKLTSVDALVRAARG